jgi:hypothetical protein
MIKQRRSRKLKFYSLAASLPMNVVGTGENSPGDHVHGIASS